MVVKSLSRRSHTGQLLQYIFNERKTADSLHSTLTIRHNVRSKTIDGMTHEFETNETYRLRKRKNNVRVYHVILSFSNKDTHITDKALCDLTKKFIELRGVDIMYAGTVHRDKKHVHVHLAISGIKYLTGESNRISRAKFQEIKHELQAYQKEKYPQLTHSLPEHGKSKQRGRTMTPYKNERTGGDKVAVAEVLHDCYSKAKSLNDFIDRLAKQNHPVYYRNGKLTGLKFENKRKFRFRRLGYDELTLANLDHAKNMEKQNLHELLVLRSKGKERGTKER